MRFVRASQLFLCLLIRASVAVDVLLNVSKTAAYARLRNELFKRDAVIHKIPPEIGCSHGEPLTLTFEFLLLDILEIDDIQQMMTVLTYLKWSWTQNDLKWNPADYDGLEKILIDSNSLWVPDVVIIVGQSGSLDLLCAPNLVLDSSGLLLCKTKTYITFRCEINFTMYPFDTQQCHFGLLYSSSLSDCPVRHSIKEMNYNTNAIFTAPYITVGEWLLKKSGAEIYQDLNNVSYPRYSFTVQRRSTFYVITILFPMVLTSIMVTLVFLIPTGTGEKISYLVSIFTSSAIFLGCISDVMPRNLSSMPLLATLLTEVMCQGLGATLATLWVVHKFEAENENFDSNAKIKPKVWITKVTPYETKQKDQPQGVDEFNSTEASSRDRPAQCYLTSGRLDRIFFIFFVVFQLTFLGVLFGVTGWTHS